MCVCASINGLRLPWISLQSQQSSCIVTIKVAFRNSDADDASLFQLSGLVTEIKDTSITGRER